MSILLSRCDHRFQCVLAYLSLVTLLCWGDGKLFGDVIIEGTISDLAWTADRNRYIVAADANVPAGKTLKIHAGVEVVLASEVSLTVHGNIDAAGTAEERVTFRAPNPELYWGSIRVVNSSGDDSRFAYCDFRNAARAVVLSLGDFGPGTSATVIENCSFNACREAGISGNSAGAVCCFPWRAYHPHLNPTIRNCSFDATGTGCLFTTTGEYSQTGAGGTITGYGQCSPMLRNNIFVNLSGTALELQPQRYSGNSRPIFANNTIVECARGVLTADPFDVVIRSNIFLRTGVGVERSGTGSGELSHNCFFQSDKHFVGFPANMGMVIWENAVGVPADIAFNIFVDPLLEAHDYQLSSASPCIDSGCGTTNCPVESFADACFPPSQGSALNDIGAHGGQWACSWPRIPQNSGRRIPGDCTEDQKLDISDAVCLFRFLFLGSLQRLPCGDGSAAHPANLALMDWQPDGLGDISDGIAVLRFLFADGPPHPSGRECMSIDDCSGLCDQ